MCGPAEKRHGAWSFRSEGDLQSEGRLPVSEIAIRAEGLGKQYRIGPRAPYKTIRETMTEALWAPFYRLSQVIGRGPESMDAGPDTTIWALKDVSFEVKRAEVVGVIGRNGAGKSTLLKILSRITEPTVGQAEICGRVSSLLEIGTGFHPELTGRENILLNGAILGMRRAEISRKFDEIVAFADIEKFIDTPVKHYSSGMYLRLAFAVAAHLDPEILLVDEVLAVGDAAFQNKCLGKMGAVAKEGRTVLFVSHNMQAISMLCDIALLLDGGAIAARGPTADVIETYLSQLRKGMDGQGADVSFPDDPDAAAQIQWIRVVDVTGVPSLGHGILDPIRVELGFKLRRAFANLFVGCTVLTGGGQIVYTTNEMDWSNYTSSEMNGIWPKEPGEYEASVTLPAPLLHAGVYEFWLTLSTPGRGNLVSRRGIFIEVTDAGSFASFPFKRRGLLAVPIPWRVEHRGSGHLAAME